MATATAPTLAVLKYPTSPANCPVPKPNTARPQAPVYKAAPEPFTLPLRSAFLRRALLWSAAIAGLGGGGVGLFLKTQLLKPALLSTPSPSIHPQKIIQENFPPKFTPPIYDTAVDKMGSNLTEPSPLLLPETAVNEPSMPESEEKATADIGNKDFPPSRPVAPVQHSSSHWEEMPPDSVPLPAAVKPNVQATEDLTNFIEPQAQPLSASTPATAPIAAPSETPASTLP